MNDNILDPSILNRHPEGKRILVVDDQTYNIDALKSILHFKLKIDLTYVDRASNGLEALNMIKQDFKHNQGKCSFDVIFMDCNMPFMDGYQATKEIRELLYEKNLRQPIISAVTGHSDQSYIDQAVNSGMNQVLEKPVQP